MSEEKYQHYPEPRPSQGALMKAADLLIADSKFFLKNVVGNNGSKKEGSSAMSMPNIYEEVKKKDLNQKNETPDRSSVLRNMASIYEGATVKEDGLATLAKLKLPRYKKIKITVEEFLEEPEQYFKLLKTSHFFPSVMNPKTGERHFELGLNQKQVFSFLERLLKSGEVSRDHLLILSEYHLNCFSGNIIINPTMEDNSQNSENIEIELVEGTHAGLAYEGSSPVIRSKKNWFGRFEPEVLLNEGLSDSLLAKLVKDSSQSSYVDFQEFREMCKTKSATKKDKEKLAYYQQLIEKVNEVLNFIPKNMDLLYNFSVSGEAFFPGYYEFILSEPVSDEKPKKGLANLVELIKNQLLGHQKDQKTPQQILKWIKSMKVYFLDYRKADHYSDLQHHYLEATEAVA